MMTLVLTSLLQIVLGAFGLYALWVTWRDGDLW